MSATTNRSVRGEPHESRKYGGAASALPRVWVAVRTNLRSVLAQVFRRRRNEPRAAGTIGRFADDPEAWVTR